MSELAAPSTPARLVGDTFDEPVVISKTLRVTRQETISEPDIDRFYALYRLAFDHLKTVAFGRQVLTEAEFVSQMRNPQVWKYVGWTAEDEAVALTTLTRSLDTVPWISPDYFAANYPEQWSRNAVYYLGFTLVHPRLRHQRFLESLLRAARDELVQARAVVAFDMCAYDERVLRFSSRITSVLSQHRGAHFETVDTQNYSRITFG